MLGKLSLSEIAVKYQVTIRTLHNWFSPFWSIEPTPKDINISDKVLIIDGKYIERTACVLVAVCNKKIASWCFTQRENFNTWLTNYKTWWQSHKDSIKEKTYPINSFTPTGRRKWHYTHQKLHASNSHLKNSLPYLFRYLQHPEIPNTSNFVEGTVNAPMQEKIRFHRGLNLSKRRILIAHFLSSKQ